MHPNFRIFVNNELLDRNLLEYFYLKKFKLNYLYDNIFAFIGKDKNEIVKEYYQNYKSDADNAKRKFLCDMLLYENVKSPFCFTDVHNKTFIMSKGNNKIIACAVNNIEYNPILLLVKEHFSLIINDLDELYKILKVLDSNAEIFRIEVDELTMWNFIHIIENESTVRNWFNWNEEYKTLLDDSVIDADSIVVLFGNLQADETIKNAVFDKRIVSNINNFIHTANSYPKFCNYFLFSKKPYNISLSYLEFVQTNLYLKEKVKFGYDKKNNLWIYNRKNIDGFTCLINVPQHLES